MGTVFTFKRWCCIFGGMKKVYMLYQELLKPGEMITVVCSKQQLMKLNQVLKKAAKVRQTSWKTNFAPWKCSFKCSRTHKKIYTGHELGSLTSLAIFTVQSAILLSFVSSHSEWFVITAFQIFWKHRKMDRWMDRLKNQGFLLAWNPYIV